MPGEAHPRGRRVRSFLRLPSASGFPPRLRLLAGIDPAGCPHEFEYGRDGKPFYMRGPNESLAVARIIAERVTEAGGHYIVALDDPAPCPSSTLRTRTSTLRTRTSERMGSGDPMREC